MMTKDVLLTRVAAIVTTLDETNRSPESMLYILYEMDMEDYQTIQAILTQGNLVNIKGNYVTLTKNGKATARKLNEAIKNV